MKKGFKKGLALTLVSAMLLSATACGGSSTPSSSVTQGGSTSPGAASEELTDELRVTTQAQMMGKYDFEGIKTDFEKKYPGVTVVYNKVDNADVTTNMLQWSQGKTNCDIAIGGSREHTVQYAAKDYIINFGDDFFTGDIARDKFFPAFFELGNVEGRQYMILIAGEVMFIVANKELMKKAGLTDVNGKVETPKTWDELYEYTKRATVVENGKTVQMGPFIDWDTNLMTYSYLSTLRGIKGNFYESDGKTIDFTSPGSKGLLTSWTKLVKDGYTPTDTFAGMDAGRTNSRARKVAVLMTAASRWVECQENVGKDNTTVIPVLGTDAYGSLVYIHGTVIPKASPKIELAKLLIKEELFKTEFHVQVLNKYGKISLLLAHYQGLENADWPTVVEATKSAVTTPLYKDFSKLDTGIQVKLQKCIKGDQSVEGIQSSLKKLIDTSDLTTGLNH